MSARITHTSLQPHCWSKSLSQAAERSASQSISSVDKHLVDEIQSHITTGKRTRCCVPNEETTTDETWPLSSAADKTSIKSHTTFLSQRYAFSSCEESRQHYHAPAERKPLICSYHHMRISEDAGFLNVTDTKPQEAAGFCDLSAWADTLYLVLHHAVWKFPPSLFTFQWYDVH